MNNMKTKVKFDVVIGNPPYQTKRYEHFKKTQPIWHHFVRLSCDLTKVSGYTCLVHPSGWRMPSGMFERTKQLLVSKQIEYLEIHDEKDGRKTFGASTRYDWYIRRNIIPYHDTKIIDEKGIINNLNINEVPFIPNFMFDIIFSLLAKNKKSSYSTQTVNLIYSRSCYDTRKQFMRKHKDDVYKHPCVYSVNVADKATLYYSSNTTQGHFGIPKVIWGSGSTGFIIDQTGEFGLTQFAGAIVDDVENLEKIALAFKSDKFKDIIKATTVGFRQIEKRVLILFRKDFWKDLIN